MAGTTVLDLNDDVLCLIFDLIAANDPPTIAYSSSGNNNQRLATHLGWTYLTHVCRYWRNLLTTGMPHLWARTLLSFPPRAFNDILDRARDVPLVLSTASSYDRYDMDLRDHNRRHIVAHLGRACSLEYDGYDYGHNFSWLRTALNDVKLPILQDLKLHASHLNPPRTFGPVSRHTWHIDAPNLRSAALRFSGTVVFRHASLRTLVIHGLGREPLDDPLRYIFEVVATQPLLETLDTSFPHPDGVEELSVKTEVPDFPTEMTCLRSVCIGTKMVEHVTRFFACFTCPSLQHLHLDVRAPGESSWHWPPDQIAPCAHKGDNGTLSLSLNTFQMSGRIQYHPRRVMLCARAEPGHLINSENARTMSAGQYPAQYRSVTTTNYANTIMQLLALLEANSLQQVVLHNLDFLQTDPQRAHNLVNALSMGFSGMLGSASTKSYELVNCDVEALDVLLAGESRPVVFPYLSEITLSLTAVGVLGSVGHFSREWEKALSVLASRRAAGCPVKRLMVGGSWPPGELSISSWLEVDKAALLKAAELVEEVVDLRIFRDE
ncbi:hypothetical protein PENSPDRAFT_406769 [Peniophora sp. CONT]|nr:hypothetical protein PENSPDRAFT_406769 [Peniophora sp. CONT]